MLVVEHSNGLNVAFGMDGSEFFKAARFKDLVERVLQKEICAAASSLHISKRNIRCEI